MSRAFTITLVLSLLSAQAIAASATIPEQNPFRGSELGALAKSVRGAESLRILFSGNVAGMRESCGCALNPKGGLERRYNFLKNEKLLQSKQNVVFLDFGNLLFKTPVIAAKDQADAIANAEKMLEGTNFFPFAAINFGLLDRVIGSEKLSKVWPRTRSPWVSSNVTPAGKFGGHLQRRVPLKTGAGELVIFGLSSPDEKPTPGWTIENPATVLTKELADLPSHVFPIVLSDLELAQLMPLAASVKRPILFLGSREIGGWDRPLEVGQALLVHLRQQGQDWGDFRFSPGVGGKRGWFSPDDAESLAQRWDDLATEAHTVRSLASSPQRSAELKNIEGKLLELAKLAPAANDIGFSFEALEMNQTFDGPNEVSKFMK